MLRRRSPSPELRTAAKLVEIYVTGDISVSGTSQIVIQPGASVTIYFAGNVDISGNGVLNGNNQPGDLMLYGIQPLPTLPNT